MSERSSMKGAIRRNGIVYVWDLAADAYVPLRPSGPPVETGERRPDTLDQAGRPDSTLEPLAPDDLTKRERETVYPTSRTLRKPGGG